MVPVGTYGVAARPATWTGTGPQYASTKDHDDRRPGPLRPFTAVEPALTAPFSDEAGTGLSCHRTRTVPGRSS